jgi:hypothetical protein
LFLDAKQPNRRTLSLCISDKETTLMFWDIFIAVAASVMQFVTAFLGWRITLNPISPKDPNHRRKKILYTSSFLIAGAIGVGSVGLAAYRTPREHAQLLIGYPAPNRAQVPDPFGVTASWGHDIQHGATFLQVDSPLAFNIWWSNVGTGPGWDGSERAHVFIEPDGAPSSETDAIDRFDKLKTSEPLRCCLTFPKGGSGFTTAFGQILSPEDYANLVNGRRVAFVLAELQYADSIGKHTVKSCNSLQPPQVGGLLIWGSCSHYNGTDR